MVCERCGDTLETLESDDRSVTVCRSCGYLDVTVSHEREAGPQESWTEALSRFEKRQSQSVDEVRVVTADGTKRPADD